MLTSILAISLFSLADGSESVVSELSLLGAKSARQVSFKADKRPNSSFRRLGEKISLDGKVLFTGESESPLVDLQTGNLIWWERIQIGDGRGRNEWIVGTMSQWGHMPNLGHMDDVGLREMESIDRWFTLGKNNTIVDIDPKSRKNPPNRLIPLAKKVSIMTTNPGQFSIQCLPGGDLECLVYAGDIRNNCYIEVWKVAKGTNKITKTNPRMKMPMNTGKRPVSVDLIHRRILYFNDSKREYSEYDCKTNQFGDLPYQSPSLSSLYYWHGLLVQSFPNAGMRIYSEDRKKISPIVRYYLIANNSSQTYFLVQRLSDDSYWLVRC
jgi:hypothetical protein